MTILEELEARMAHIKSRASFFMAKRRKDAELYEVLSETLAICEEVERRGIVEEVRKSVAEQPKNGRNRVFAERGSDVYVIVGRAVFEPEINRGSSWRYSSAMREAAKRQIHSSQLVGWLIENGGINTLFKGRGTFARAVNTRTLHLNNSIEIDKHKPITITIKMDHRGFFDVLGAA